MPAAVTCYYLSAKGSKLHSFDIHKVAGIITATFLALTAFTGFSWNFSEYTTPAIYAATFTLKPAEPTSTPIPGKSPLPFTELLQRADAALPGAKITSINPLTAVKVDSDSGSGPTPTRIRATLIISVLP